MAVVGDILLAIVIDPVAVFVIYNVLDVASIP